MLFSKFKYVNFVEIANIMKTSARFSSLLLVVFYNLLNRSYFSTCPFVTIGSIVAFIILKITLNGKTNLLNICSLIVQSLNVSFVLKWQKEKCYQFDIIRELKNGDTNLQLHLSSTTVLTIWKNRMKLMKHF